SAIGRSRIGGETRRWIGLRPSRCSSVAHTSMGLSGCFAASSATVSASFFISCFLRGACSLRVAGTRRLDRPANRLERFPSALHTHFSPAEFARHPMCALAARPQTAIRRWLLKPNLQLSQKLRLENRRRRTIVATKITQRLRTNRVVAGQ